MAQDEILWSAPEFPYYEKGISWHGVVALVTLGVVIIALFQKNFLFAVFALISGGLVAFWGNRPPEMLTFRLNEKGLDIEKRRFYPMESFTGIAVREPEAGAELGEVVLRTKNVLASYLKIPVPASQVGTIAGLIKKFVPEMEYQPTIVDYITRLLRL